MDVLQGQGGDGVGERILPIPRIQDPQVRKPQILDDHVHGFRGARGVGAFELEAPAPSPPQQHQVQLGAALGGVEVRLPLPVRDQRLLQGESLPARAVARVRRQVLHLFQPQQEVQDAAVAQVDLGRLDEALAQVLEPGRQHPDHERPRQQIAVVVHRGDAHVHRAPQFRGVPGLPVVVRQHPPEAAQRLGRDLRAQPRNVPLQEGARERLHPSPPGRGRAREIRPWKAAAHPEPVLAPRPGLGERESAHVHEEDAPRQRLGHAPDQIPGGAAQQQEDRVPVPVVADRAQHLEQPRHPLHLVDDHQALAPAEQPLGGPGERRPGGGHLQVEDRGRPRPRGRHLSGQGRLAHLPGAQQGHHRGFGEPFGDRRQQIGARSRLLHIVLSSSDIQRFQNTRRIGFRPSSGIDGVAGGCCSLQPACLSRPVAGCRPRPAGFAHRPARLPCRTS